METNVLKKDSSIDGVKNYRHRVYSKKYDVPHFKEVWHYHPEYELLYSHNVTGTLMVADSIVRINCGDIFMFSPYMPHFLKNDDIYYDENSEHRAITTVIRFREDAFGKDFFQIPEMLSIRKLLKLSEKGIRIKGNIRKIVAQKMNQILDMKGVQKITTLLEILDMIAKSDVLDSLPRTKKNNLTNLETGDRMYRVYEYIMENLSSSISLNDAASIAKMSKTGFCRYFKSKTQKTFTEYVNEIRIDYARSLLMEGKLNIAQIGYECGFNHPSYFHKMFKTITYKTPLEYQEQMRNYPESIQNILDVQ